MKLDSRRMAEFVARGVLRFDAAIPDDINQQFLAQAGSFEPPQEDTPQSLATAYREMMRSNDIPAVAAGTPVFDAYAPDTALGRLIRVPLVQGAIESLVGPGALLDHHFLHVTFPPQPNRAGASQHTHQDSTIDPRMAFDIQIMYFPHEVTPEMGGTRYVPGTHLRVVSEAAIGRYQNVLGQQHVVCPAGTILFTHHGIWHGGGYNSGDMTRMMFKIRLNPTVRQTRLWDTADLSADDARQGPIFSPKADRPNDAIQAILTRPEPWFEADTGRLEYLNRVRLWRFLLGDETFDADYWVTRIENEPTALID